MIFDEAVHHHRALYVDLEWLCWDSPPPPGMKQEIIEIGVVEMNLSTLEISQEPSYFIRPKRWEISLKCAHLTGITRDDILAAKSFSEVIADINQRFRPAATPSCAWGDDLPILAKHCDSMHIASPFRQPIDLCKVFQGLLATRRAIGLTDAIAIAGLTFDGVPHGALPDARNCARVHAAMMRRMYGETSGAKAVPAAVAELVPLSPFAQKLVQSLKFPQEENNL